MTSKPSLLIFPLLLLSCAATVPTEGRMGQESAPCSGCATGKPIVLQVQEKVFHTEISPQWLRDSLAIQGTVAVLPALQARVQIKGSCKYCHALSENALDFDFGSGQDSLLLNFLKIEHLEVMLPGALIPERDSTLWVLWQDTLKSLSMTLSPRDKKIVIQERELNPSQRSFLARLCARWGVRYLVIPQEISLRMDASGGEAGAYEWKIQWRFWDALQGRLLMAVDLDLDCVTTTNTPPDKDWGKPAIQRLGALFAEIRGSGSKWMQDWTPGD